VAGTSWGSGAGPATTLTAFSLGDRIEHLASGSVPGYVTDQFAMAAAADGTFRIATQTGWWGRSASSSLHVLGRQGRDFVTLGSVTGIAPGEDLKAVRFIDDQAFVVTFEQVDPLFVIDLADPRNPRITGELKTPGTRASSRCSTSPTRPRQPRWRPSRWAAPTAGLPRRPPGITTPSPGSRPTGSWPCP
jgi:hypothetical protein